MLLGLQCLSKASREVFLASSSGRVAAAVCAWSCSTDHVLIQWQINSLDSLLSSMPLVSISTVFRHTLNLSYNWLSSVQSKLGPFVRMSNAIVTVHVFWSKETSHVAICKCFYFRSPYCLILDELRVSARYLTPHTHSTVRFSWLLTPCLVVYMFITKLIRIDIRRFILPLFQDNKAHILFT